MMQTLRKDENACNRCGRVFRVNAKGHQALSPFADVELGPCGSCLTKRRGLYLQPASTTVEAWVAVPFIDDFELEEAADAADGADQAAQLRVPVDSIDADGMLYEGTYPSANGHERERRGRCSCGKFCHTFGQGDDRKLARHIVTSTQRKPEREFIVKVTMVLIWQVNATDKHEAARIAEQAGVQAATLQKRTVTRPV